MEFKPNWDETKANYRAWWAGEPVGRPLLQITAPIDPQSPSGWDWLDLARNPNDIPGVVDRYENEFCKRVWFGCEAVPNLWLNFGAGIPAVFMNDAVSMNIGKDTIWFHPKKLYGWDELLKLDFDETNACWRTIKRAAKELSALSKDKWLVGNTDLNSEHIVLAHIRGNQNLLIDLVDCPENVVKMDMRIHAMWLKCYEELNAILKPANGGTTWWMDIFCEELASDIQNDFSAMLSPRMFGKYCMDDLVDSCRRIPRTIYHWDGPGQIPHLKHLLSIEELDGIQWVPGAGQPSCEDPKWYDLYRQIRASGKKLVLQQISDARRIKDVIEAVGPEQLLFKVKCGSIPEAEALVRDIELWSRKSAR